MNVYFYNPCYLNAEKFPILAEILKVKQVIDLTDPNTRNNELVKYYQPIAIYIRQEADVEQSIRDAVYKFNEPICKPKIENGKFTGGFIVNDLYKNSNAYNPIYNLEKCNDENTFIFYTSNENKTLCKDFTKHSLNILKKYAKKESYDNKICFCWIDSLLNYASMHYKNKFYSLQLEIESNNSSVRYYNPLLSYINLKQTYLSKGDIFQFFLTDLGRKQMEKLFEYKFKTMFISNTDDDIYYEEESTDIDSDLNYIAHNGGDWIFD